MGESGSKEIVKLGCLRSKYGHGAHEYGKSGIIQGQILPHVENLLYGGSDLFHRKVVSKKDTDPAYVSRHMKKDSLGIVDSQDNFSKEVDDPDMDMHNDKEGEEGLKEDEQSHLRKLVESINRLARNVWP